MVSYRLVISIALGVVFSFFTVFFFNMQGIIQVIQATAGSDFLKTMTAGVIGQKVIIMADSGDTITVDETDNFDLSTSTFALSGNDTLTVICDGTNWIEIARSNN